MQRVERNEGSTQQINIFFRYNVWSTAFKTLLFKLYFGAAFATFTFANLTSIIRFVQVVIWKRVMEINEELASAVINRSVAIVCLSVGLLCHPGVLNYPIFISIFSEKFSPKVSMFFSPFLLQLFPKLCHGFNFLKTRNSKKQ